MSTEPTDRARTPTDDEMPSLLEALAAAGGNVSAVAREHGVTTWKLYEAQRVARGELPRRLKRAAEQEFVQVEVVEVDRASPAHLELVLASGHRLLIPVGFDKPTLRLVIGLLASC